jgi:hypothetical protein
LISFKQFRGIRRSRTDTGCIFSVPIAATKKRNQFLAQSVRFAEITKGVINMTANAALFLFLAAIVVSVFAFLSLVAWVTAPSKERQARDRFALLKTLAELPGENAARVLDILQKEDQARTARRAHDERRSWVDGGIVLVAIGLGLAVMLMAHGDSGNWSVGLIPGLLGIAMILIGILRKQTTHKETK